MKLKFTVPFDTDPNKVKKIFQKIGAEMMQDEVHKAAFKETGIDFARREVRVAIPGLDEAGNLTEE